VVEFDALQTLGTILTCSKAENADLFRAIPGSFGSIAVITAARVLCIRAEPFVHVEVMRYSAVAQLTQAMEISQRGIMAAASTAWGAPLFIEGFSFSASDLVAVLGRFSAEERAREHGALKLLKCIVWGGL